MNERSLSIGQNTLVVEDAVLSGQPKTVTVEVKEVKTENAAFITVTPGTGQGLSRSAFRVQIPI